METGRVIAGKFKLTRELGQGGMGAVWAAVHQTLGREVAVKFLHPQIDHTKSLTERFVSEARMVASLKHRFIVDVFDFGVTEDGLYYMVLELLQGRALAHRMDHGPAFSVAIAVELMADCLRGLQVVHDAGIVHRDLKPDNIFVIEDADGTFPKLIDFGISKRTETSEALKPFGKSGGKTSRLTRPGTVVGTPYYMSPEQLRGRNDIDRRADIYSVGVILYELLAGRLPFVADNIGDLMVAITVKGAPSLATLRPDLGADIPAVVTRALAPDPSDRYASANELRDALLALLPRLPSEAKSVVQHQQPATDSQIGQHTNLQLKAAKNPLLESFVPTRRALQRAPAAWLIALGFLMVTMVLVWWLGGSEPRTAALPLHVSASVPRVIALPLPPTPTAAEPSSTGVAVGPEQAETPPPSAADARPIKRAAPRALRPTVQNRRANPAPARQRSDAPQKLFHKLDF